MAKDDEQNCCKHGCQLLSYWRDIYLSLHHCPCVDVYYLNSRSVCWIWSACRDDRSDLHQGSPPHPPEICRQVVRDCFSFWLLYLAFLYLSFPELRRYRFRLEFCHRQDWNKNGVPLGGKCKVLEFRGDGSLLSHDFLNAESSWCTCCKLSQPMSR